MKKINKHKIFIFIILILSLFLLFMFFKEFFFEIIKYQINKDFDGMKAFVEDKGIIGCLLIVLMQGIQMIGVFISTEFLQTAVAMSYPWFITVLLCNLGVIVGSSIIYILVNAFKFDSSIFKKTSAKIKNLSIKNNNTQILMYVLFIMPVVPFGAICYYGASQNMSYRRYILTCASGSLPSIIVSVFLGNAIRYIIANEISWWILVAIVIIFMVLLLLLCTFLLKKVFNTSTKNTPDSSWYSVFILIFKFLFKSNSNFNKVEQLNFDGPFVILSNHPSPYDAYLVSQTIYPIKPAFIMNRYYFKNKINKKLLNKIGVIPKKLFSPDMETIKKSLKMVKSGYPIYMCPEGRLGLDGTNYAVSIETAKFIKQLKLPLLIIKINGAYIAKPKWRKKQFKTKVRTEISTILSSQEINNKSIEELNQIINDGIKYNDFEFIKRKNLKFKSKNKALGLENILYYCPHCHKEHCLSTLGNTIKCNVCNFELTIQEDYHFNENEYNINNIHDWYELIKDFERNNIKNNIQLSCDVIVKKYNFNDSSFNEEGKGTCYLNNTEFKFVGDLKVKEFTHKIENLKALAFSCGEEFECYFNDELYYFYPIENKSQCAKWALIVDELQNSEVDHEKQNN